MRVYHLIWCEDVGWPVLVLWSIVLTIVKVWRWSHIQKWVDLQNTFTTSFKWGWGLRCHLGCLWNEDISSDMMWRCGTPSIRFVIDCANESEGLHGSHIQQLVDFQNTITAFCCRVWGLGRRLGCFWNDDVPSDMMGRCGMTSIRFVFDRAIHSKGFALITHSNVTRHPECHYRFL
jgi:hypothetical protein